MASTNVPADDLNIAAPPWDYNPSAWSQRLPIALLAAVAFVLASYMAMYQWRLIPSAWDPVWGDETMQVLDSDVSEEMKRWIGIPDGALGAIAYLGDILFGLAGSTRRWHYRPWLVILFGIDVIPVGGVSAILVFLQATVVGKWCFLCIITAIISLILIWFAYDEVWSSIRYLWRVWKKYRNFSISWDAFWGVARRELMDPEFTRR